MSKAVNRREFFSQTAVGSVAAGLALSSAGDTEAKEKPKPTPPSDRINVGFVVDTHIGRLATRMQLTWSSKDAKDAVKIERDLMELFAREEWTFLGHALIQHGRRVCSARKPQCDKCTLADYCPAAGSVENDKPARQS